MLTIYVFIWFQIVHHINQVTHVLISNESHKNNMQPQRVSAEEPNIISGTFFLKMLSLSFFKNRHHRNPSWVASIQECCLKSASMKVTKVKKRLGISTRGRPNRHGNGVGMEPRRSDTCIPQLRGWVPPQGSLEAAERAQ